MTPCLRRPGAQRHQAGRAELTGHARRRCRTTASAYPALGRREVGLQVHGFEVRVGRRAVWATIRRLSGAVARNRDSATELFVPPLPHAGAGGRATRRSWMTDLGGGEITVRKQRERLSVTRSTTAARPAPAR